MTDLEKLLELIAIGGFFSRSADAEKCADYLIANGVAPVVHGRWVDRYGGKYANPTYDCSECKRKALYKPETDELGAERFVQELSDICPNCGARMDGGEG